MASDGNIIGQRLLASVVEQRAQNEPNRPWAMIPRSEDLTTGFIDITYRQFANAIDRAAFWLERVLGESQQPFETFAYVGQKDIRYPIIAVAAVKSGRKVLLPSPFTTKEAQIHLVEKTDCHAVVCSKNFESQARSLAQASHDVPTIVAPELHELLDERASPHYAYTKSWEEAKHDPWIIMHTSGTTGLPKPIIYTNKMMASLDAARLMPDQDDETIMDQFADCRWYTPLPSLHFVGMTCALQLTVFCGSTIVFGPAEGPATPEVVKQILDYGIVDGIMVPPSLLESLCRDEKALQKVKELQYVQYAGASLAKDIGDMIAKDTSLVAAIGSTEAGAWFPRIPQGEHDEWNYYSFMKGTGIDFEHRGGDLYELVFRRVEEYSRWQQIFDVFPDLDVFHTKDLFRKHPSKDDLWSYEGRADDVVNLSHGKDVSATKLERIIESHPKVLCALVGGEGRHSPFLIVELEEETIGRSSESTDMASNRQRDRLNGVWPAVEKANESCWENVRLTKDLTLIAEPAKPLPRTTKGTVARREAAALYQEHIDKLYAK
ncbi:MAG: hypothetical protein Q9200_005078 [Gallowayella weberi]